MAECSCSGLAPRNANQIDITLTRAVSRFGSIVSRGTVAAWVCSSTVHVSQGIVQRALSCICWQVHTVITVSRYFGPVGPVQIVFRFLIFIDKGLAFMKRSFKLAFDCNWIGDEGHVVSEHVAQGRWGMLHLMPGLHNLCCQ